LTVAYFGPEATYTHMAARDRFGSSTNYVAMASIPDVFQEVKHGRVDYGVVPIENSTEGGVSATLTALLESSLSIRGELVIPVHLCLAARHRDFARLRRVASHPQPLAQCRHWLENRLPDAELVSLSSTTAAAIEAQRDDALAAVTSRLGAELYALEILAEGIQDSDENATRFVVVGHEDQKAATGRDKTSVVFSTPHERGALRRALGVFDDEHINLTRIESRPTPGKRWEYVFFTDLEGHREDPPVARALLKLGTFCSTVRVLGSYPRAPDQPK
ncbi:MAG TPA: prephenate dehydratase, partial [Polyangiaceae bacterium]|nr:prephenate dehydratase [Polyangiaceae bacterium]